MDVDVLVRSGFALAKVPPDDERLGRLRWGWQRVLHGEEPCGPGPVTNVPDTRSETVTKFSQFRSPARDKVRLVGWKAGPESGAEVVARLEWEFVVGEFRISDVLRDAPGADLSGADLSYQDLHDCNMPGADLTGAALVGARLYGTNLAGACLSDANLDRADMWNAVLTDISLQYARLVATDLSSSDMRGAEMSNAYVDRATFREANLEGVVMRKTQVVRCDFAAADLSKSFLSESAWSLTDVTDADFTDADLTCANLYFTDLNRTASVEGYVCAGLTIDGKEVAPAPALEENAEEQRPQRSSQA